MVAHVEPGSQQTFVVSFPRDLMVDVPGESGKNRINSAYASGGPQVVIDTLKENFEIDINHYLEVDFKSFQEIVDTIGNVQVYLPGRVRDQETGLNTPYGGGCYPLDGAAALAYVRSRNLEISDPNGPIVDPDTGEHWRLLDQRADLDRIARQQAFIRKLAGLAISKSLSDPFLALNLADNVLKYVKADEGLSRSDVNALIRAFRTVDVNDPSSIRFETLPVDPDPNNPNVTLVPSADADAVIQQLRTFGDNTPKPATVAPSQVKVRVTDATGTNVGQSVVSKLTELGLPGHRRQPGEDQDPGHRDPVRVRPGGGGQGAAAVLHRRQAGARPEGGGAHRARARLVVPGHHGAVDHDDGGAQHGARRAGHHRTADDDHDPGAVGDRPLPLSGDRIAGERPVHCPAVRILVTGAGGQVGARVVEALAPHDVLGVAHDALDLADREQVEQVVAEFGPDAVVNAAAMTNVDACERDPEHAFAVNALGVRTLAQATARRGAHLVHISTDYVFDGTAARPYDEWDAVHPLSEYGRSKLGGEVEVAAHAGSWATVRTSWVFGRRGTDLVSWAFGAFDRGELDGVLADQVSIPTYAPDLAVLLARFAVERRQGLFHVTSGSEAVTRHELIVTALRARGLDPSRAWRRSTPPTSTGPRPGRR